MAPHADPLRVPGLNAMCSSVRQRGPMHAGVGQFSEVERGPREAIAACSPDEHWFTRLSRIRP